MICIIIVFALMYRHPARQPLKTDSGTNIPASDISYRPQNNVKTDNKDPLSLSFSDNEYRSDAKIRNALSKSKLEYCSHLIENGNNSYILTWNLAENDKEVYRCTYSYNRNSKTDSSQAVCRLSEGYEDYKNGNTKLLREYVMPEADDHIDMWIKENGSSYYDEQFILGKYSDMECYIRADDIYLTYYWYQDTEKGPALVYKSTARNTDTTSGQKYNEDLWELFEESYKNIHIIPYKEYPRDFDYFEVYREWKNRQNSRKEEENLKEKTDIYCECEDEMDLYTSYEEDFYDYDDALNFYEEYCYNMNNN